MNPWESHRYFVEYITADGFIQTKRITNKQVFLDKVVYSQPECRPVRNFHRNMSFNYDQTLQEATDSICIMRRYEYEHIREEPLLDSKGNTIIENDTILTNTIITYREVFQVPKFERSL